MLSPRGKVSFVLKIKNDFPILFLVGFSPAEDLMLELNIKQANKKTSCLFICYKDLKKCSLFMYVIPSW